MWSVDVHATGYTMRVLAVNLLLRYLMGSQHVVPEGEFTSAEKSTGNWHEQTSFVHDREAQCTSPLG